MTEVEQIMAAADAEVRAWARTWRKRNTVEHFAIGNHCVRLGVETIMQAVGIDDAIECIESILADLRDEKAKRS